MNHRALRSLTLVVLAAATLALPLAGCSTGSEDEAATTTVGSTADTSGGVYAEVLWRDRSVGLDNVTTLVSDAGFGPASSYAVRLVGHEGARGVEIAYPDAFIPGKTYADFTPSAIYLLGTVGPLDSVTVTGHGKVRFTLTDREASARLGFDVKELGWNHAKLVNTVRGAYY